MSSPPADRPTTANYYDIKACHADVVGWVRVIVSNLDGIR